VTVWLAVTVTVTVGLVVTVGLAVTVTIGLAMLARRRHQPPAAAALAAVLAKRPTEPRRPAEPRAPAEPVPIQSRRPRKATPAQDEWGFFDPQQCGFAALLAKLDEFSDDEPKSRS